MSNDGIFPRKPFILGYTHGFHGYGKPQIQHFLQASSLSQLLLQEFHLLSRAMQLLRPLRVLKPDAESRREDDLGGLTEKHGDLTGSNGDLMRYHEVNHGKHIDNTDNTLVNYQFAMENQ